ncbi:MAG: LysR family transcriptional regulator [Pseudomonadota bacterium]
MQSFDWNDLKYFLAVYRSGSLLEAGRQLKVSDTTVSRRIKTLEEKLGSKLFRKNATGRYEMTELAVNVLSLAEDIESQTIAIEETAGRTSTALTGIVRISAVPMIINRVLVRQVDVLLERHPELKIELVPEERTIDLSKRDADLAIRFSNPVAGGYQTKAQKIGSLGFAVYGPRAVEKAAIDALPWIGYDDIHSALPQAQWINARISRDQSNLSSISVADLETAFEVVANCLGKSLLPDMIAGQDNRFTRLVDNRDSVSLERPVWLLSHKDQNARRSIVAVKQWLSEIIWH